MTPVINLMLRQVTLMWADMHMMVRRQGRAEICLRAGCKELAGNWTEALAVPPGLEDFPERPSGMASRAADLRIAHGGLTHMPSMRRCLVMQAAVGRRALATWCLRLSAP